MSTKQRDILQSQTNVEEPNNSNSHSSKLIARDEIEGTPFTLIENDKKEHFIVMGNYRITHIHQTSENAINELKTEQWNIILNMIISVNEKIKEMDIENGKIKTNGNK